MLMRGGTSKGAYFVASDLPTETTSRDELLMAVMGTPDPRQIDGIGGADPGQGSGLVGLRDRVEALGGSLEITSKPGDGTSLVVALPIRH